MMMLMMMRSARVAVGTSAATGFDTRGTYDSCLLSFLQRILLVLLFFNSHHHHHHHHHVDAFVIPKGKSTHSTKRIITTTTTTTGQQQQQQQASPLFFLASSSTSSSSSYSSSSSVTSSTALLSNSNSKKWSDFDYEQHWYPVSWICDLRHNEPTKVTLFDVDYVVAVDKKSSSSSKNGDDSNNIKITALRDRCPHRSAALSEGRITSNGAIQCAYHGWSFNGTTGECLQIPQSSASTSTFSSRTCATSIPALAHQGMLWLWPGPRKENIADYPLPPTIPEIDSAGYKTVRVVRDFPQVDWTLLVSNILDPDHGLFAHQTPPFDWYSASPDQPMTIDETFDHANHGWTMFSAVPAVEKLLKVDKEKRNAKQKSLSSSSSSSSSSSKTTTATRTKTATKDSKPKQQYMATSSFYAPTTVILCRRPVGQDGVSVNRTASPSFLTAFWVSPVGTGKSRFFSCSCSKMLSFNLPRWFLHYNLNNFLDQDTVLVASQQPGTLTAEALGQGRSSSSTTILDTTSTTTTSTTTTTTPLYAYASPTDKAVRLLDQFWDATTARAPNRRQRLQEMLYAGQLRHVDAGRNVILDRKAQHLDLCPDSQDTVRNAKRLRNLCSLVSVWLLLVSNLLVPTNSMSQAGSTTTAFGGGSGGGAVVNVVAALVLRAASMTVKIKPKYRVMLLLVSSLVAFLSHKLQRGFYFNYPEWKRNRDLKNIPAKTWMDP